MEKKKVTAGAVVPENQHAITEGYRGPMILQEVLHQLFGKEVRGIICVISGTYIDGM